MQIDTGATCNVLLYCYLPTNTTVESNNRTAYIYQAKIESDRHNICNPKNTQYREEFLVVEDGSIPLLGSKTVENIELLVIQHQNILQVGNSNFEVCEQQTLPSLTKEDISSGNEDLFTGQEESTAGVSGLVASTKPNGKVRVCIDPQHLNTALKQQHYLLPIVEEILPELAKARAFSKADTKDGYPQIQLDRQAYHISGAMGQVSLASAALWNLPSF